uniref:ATP synthase complex subunit 8 n=3 Tax=Pampus TaxID=163125 RepID=A0A9E8YH93_9SCOM|nr:ATP synthase F0 subunit 8 [Pampus liuorum]AIH00457.1 ATP synthase F0 subunit 8 [Pampus argenteus]AVN90157.1 ATP synthase F0 subunit 8 [Pampus cinereus]WAJ58174.1 ATP synthase F0 subunit 8 [Pampus liuorum]WAJ58187.1 ATP synthase F0 subunit 8 [Pampus liuorum]
MPQLDLEIWFMMLIHSWFAFLVIVVPKVLAHSFTKVTPPKKTQKTETKAWDWPWH